MGRRFNTLFTMLLFLVFVLCALFTVLFGSRVYENINSRMEDNYAGSVALNYIANKVRQGDTEGAVHVRQIDGTDVLELEKTVGGGTYVTWIYYRDGAIRELFTDTESGLGLDDGLEIMAGGGLRLREEGGLLSVQTEGKGGGSLTLSLRSGGLRDE